VADVERFTRDARRALVLAHEHAEALQHPSIGPAHILLGLLGVADGLAARALNALGVTEERAVKLVAADAGSPWVAHLRPIQFSAGHNDVVGRTAAHARGQ
jgi:ATP-dependent Clp protease ATP-binding subunit ClpA